MNTLAYPSGGSASKNIRLHLSIQTLQLILLEDQYRRISVRFSKTNTLAYSSRGSVSKNIRLSLSRPTLQLILLEDQYQRKSDQAFQDQRLFFWKISIEECQLGSPRPALQLILLEDQYRKISVRFSKTNTLAYYSRGSVSKNIRLSLSR